jgi:hypothetical protein
VDHHRIAILVDLDVFDHRPPVDTDHLPPYRGTEHAVLLHLVPDRSTGRSGILLILQTMFAQ